MMMMMTTMMIIMIIIILMDFEKHNSQLFSDRLKAPRASPTCTLAWKHSHNDRNINTDTDTWYEGTAQPAKCGKHGTSGHNHNADKSTDTHTHRTHSTWCKGIAQLFRIEFGIAFIFNFYYCLQ